jgi:hypothetical protein
LLSPFAPEVSQPRIRRSRSEAVQLAAVARLFNQTDATDSICFIEPGKLLVRLEPPGAERTALHQIKTRDRLKYPRPLINRRSLREAQRRSNPAGLPRRASSTSQLQTSRD